MLSYTTTKLLPLVFLSQSAFFVLSQQGDDGNTTITDSDLTSGNNFLFANYNVLREEGQGFFLYEIVALYETPESALVPFVSLEWWCDLEFLADDGENYGYVGRSVRYFLGSSLEDLLAQGAQSPSSTKRAESVSAIFVPTLGIFEGQIHPTHDDYTKRFWDDGNPTIPTIGWEGHDEGDNEPTADTSAWSNAGRLTKISAKEAAEYLGMDESDLTPETCTKQYKEAWNTTHQPDPINTTMITIQEEVAQLKEENKELLSRTVAIEADNEGLKADNKDMMSRLAAIEESLAVNGGDATSTSTYRSAWYYNSIIDNMIKPIMILAAITGFIVVEFI